MLLAKTLRSSTFRLALVCIALFGAVVFALFGYVYWSTAFYVRNRSDQAISAEFAIMQKAYANAGRSGLLTTIAQRLANQRFDGSVYLLADSSLSPLAGNLTDWPSAMKGSNGWGSFTIREDRPLVRATFETLPDGSHFHLIDIRACRGGQRVRHAAHGGAHRSHQRDQSGHHPKRSRSADSAARDR